MRPMHPIPRLLVVLTLLLAAADTAAAQSQREIVLRVGDVVRINSWRNPELSGDIVVDADGTLRHPLYGGVRAAGVTLSELVGGNTEPIGLGAERLQQAARALTSVRMGAG